MTSSQAIRSNQIAAADSGATPESIERSTEKPRLSLSGEYFTSETIFSQEITRIFSKQWVLVGRTEQIPQPGDYFLTKVANESIIVLRKRDGTLGAYYNVCRHRGTRLCTTEKGHFPGMVTCSYHGWSYDLEGQLRGARCMQEVPGFDAAQFPLHRVSVDEWESFIFLNLAENPSSVATQLSPVSQKFSGYQMEKLRVAKRIDYDVQANWKLVIQNYSECYHCPILHPALEKLSSFQSGANELSQGMLIGGYSALRPGIHSLTLSGKPAAPPIKNMSSTDLDRVYYYLIFPNMLLSLHSDYVMVHTLRPISPGQTFISCEWLFHPDAFSADPFRPDDAVEFWDITNRQDWQISELTQFGVNSRVYQPGFYAGEEEELLYAFDQEYLRALGGNK